MTKPIQIFISYAQEDAVSREALTKHLASLRRSGKVTLWSDNQITLGVNWDDQTRDRLCQADIVALLLSGDFMNSDHIWDNELKESLARREKGEKVMLLPILVKPCLLTGTIFEKIQRLPRNQQAVSEHANLDEAWYKIAVEISAVVDSFQETVSAVSQATASGDVADAVNKAIGNKNMISGSVIIVGGNLHIGDGK
jgi:hypothetical protein